MPFEVCFWSECSLRSVKGEARILRGAASDIGSRDVEKEIVFCFSMPLEVRYDRQNYLNQPSQAA